MELEDRWILPLRGNVVTRIDAGEKTVFALDSDVQIIVGDRAYFTAGSSSGSTVARIELRQHDQRTLAKSVGTRVLSAVGFKSGALRVVLSSGWHLNVTRTQPLVLATVIAGDTALWARSARPAPSEPGDSRSAQRAGATSRAGRSARGGRPEGGRRSSPWERSE